VVSGLEHFDFNRCVHDLTMTGGANAVFPSKTQFVQTSEVRFRRWAKHHHFPNINNLYIRFRDFLQNAWAKHQAALHEQPRWTFRDAKKLIQMLPKNYIIQCEDHAANHIMVFCPVIYHKMMVNTWLDETVFESVDHSIADSKKRIRDCAPPCVQKRYKKLVNFNQDLPYGYLLPKRKKQWLLGRTIIAYSASMVKRLLAILAKAIQMMIHCTWGVHFGASMPLAWKAIHAAFQHHDSSRTILLYNQDLVGFFNSIPQEDILSSLHALVVEHTQQHGPIIMVAPPWTPHQWPLCLFSTKLPREFYSHSNL
jgi:hypothetical protein